MVKSKAEIMKEYRRRLKEDPIKYEEYLSQARQRKKKNYIPAKELSRKEKLKRSDKNKVYLQRHREKKKREREIEEAQPSTSMETSGYETGHSDHTPLVVNLAFPNRRNGPRKRINRALAKKSKELKKLSHDYQNLQMKYKKTIRNLQRIKKKVRENKQDIQIEKNTDQRNKSVLTPKTKTNELIRTAGLSNKQQKKVKKQLLFGFMVKNQMSREKRGMKMTKQGSLRTLIGDEILKKYRLKHTVSKDTGLARNRLKGLNVRDFIRRREVRKHRQSVIDFLMRDDNSRSNPGKRDKLKSNGETQQTRTLTDYLKNLHQKYLCEHPNVKLSLSSFKRIRPSFIRLSALITRSSCLCTRHQNMAMCTRALKNSGVDIPLNPEEFVQDEQKRKLVEAQVPQSIKFGQWKRVPVEDKGRKKMVTKIIDQQMQKDEFIAFFKDKTADFEQHVCRVKKQYDEIRLLKANLSSTDAILHMDFAENYVCKTVEEVQSAYWTQTGVTLHPIVIYYKQDDKLAHKSIVVLSDEQGHNSSTVLAFLDKVIPRVKQVVPNLERFHYWTDSPTSQYRNKTIFNTIARHREIYGMAATWNYFESGHGKGPCDGLGGLTKRMADEAVRSGKTVIQDAQDFYSWTQSSTCTMKSVEFLFVSSEDCKTKSEQLGKILVKPIPGTMKVHAIVGGSEAGKILKADVSCYCSGCRSGTFCEGHWQKETITVVETEDNNKMDVTDQSDFAESKGQQFKPGDFVAAVYMEQWYIGKITDVDGEESEISFMKTNEKSMTFQWPSNEDKFWVESKDIISKVDDPVATGRSKRAYKLTEWDLEKVIASFELKNSSV